MNTAVAQQQHREQEILPAISPLELMQDAITKGASVELMEQLLDLYKSARDFQAEKAFHAAMAKAKAEIPVIAKTNSAFGRYLYEDIGDIADVVVPILSKYDLYYRWETAPGSSPGITIVTCVIAHKDGHSIRNSLPAVAETTRNSNMNANQAVGSSITFMQRYSLKAALGLAAAKDDDAQSAGSAAKPQHKEGGDADARGSLRIDKNAEPFELQLRTDSDAAAAWSTWATTLMAYVRNAPTADKISEWIAANTEPLAKLSEYDSGKYTKLNAMIQHQIAAKDKDADA
jgi:hypothetical protein